MGDRDEHGEPAPADNGPPAFTFLNLAQTLGAYLALPVVLLYPFGFVALFAQFTNFFRLDFYTAWYAASLVNRVVIVGQGATILTVALVGVVLLSGMVVQTVAPFPWSDDAVMRVTEPCKKQVIND